MTLSACLDGTTGNGADAAPEPLLSRWEHDACLITAGIADNRTDAIRWVLALSASNLSSSASASGVHERYIARRRTSQTVTAMSSTDNASSPPPSIPWTGQKRLAGW